MDRPLLEGEVDPYVEHLVQRHTDRDPMAHGASEIQVSPFRLSAPITKEQWQTDRAGIIQSVNQSNKSVGFDAWVYESTNTYAEDAMKCYNAHNRPAAGCIDWWDDSKRIGRPTGVGKEILKDNHKLGQNDPHLCQWCPVATHVRTEVNFKKGLYK